MTLFTAKNVRIVWSSLLDRWVVAYRGPSEIYECIGRMSYDQNEPDENLLLEAMQILKRDGLKMGTEEVKIERD